MRSLSQQDNRSTRVSRWFLTFQIIFVTCFICVFLSSYTSPQINPNQSSGLHLSTHPSSKVPTSETVPDPLDDSSTDKPSSKEPATDTNQPKTTDTSFNPQDSEHTTNKSSVEPNPSETETKISSEPQQPEQPGDNSSAGSNPSETGIGSSSETLQPEHHKEDSSVKSYPPIIVNKYKPDSGYNPPASSFVVQPDEDTKIGILGLEGIAAFLTNGGVTPRRSKIAITLCNMGEARFCQSRYPAEVIDLLYSFAPIYGWEDQNRIQVLYERHRYFVSYMRSIGVSVVVLEAIYPGQTFLATTAGNEPWEIQLKVEDSFYYRENFLNVAARKTDAWEYLLWIDGHQMFDNVYWWQDTIVKLEKFGTVQMFQYLYYRRGPGNNTDYNVNFAGIQYAGYLARPFYRFHEVARGLWAGNAWGIRKEVYKEVDYILDTCVCGWCDSAYNIPTFEEKEDWALFNFPNYYEQLKPWVNNANTAFKKYGIGPAIVRGNIVHLDHERFSKAEIEVAQKRIGFESFDMSADLYRDENFTLHTREGSPLATLFTKRKWS